MRFIFLALALLFVFVWAFAFIALDVASFFIHILLVLAARFFVTYLVAAPTDVNKTHGSI